MSICPNDSTHLLTPGDFCVTCWRLIRPTPPKGSRTW